MVMTWTLLSSSSSVRTTELATLTRLRELWLNDVDTLVSTPGMLGLFKSISGALSLIKVISTGMKQVSLLEGWCTVILIILVTAAGSSAVLE